MGYVNLHLDSGYLLDKEELMESVRKKTGEYGDRIILTYPEGVLFHKLTQDEVENYVIPSMEEAMGHIQDGAVFFPAFVTEGCRFRNRGMFFRKKGGKFDADTGYKKIRYTPFEKENERSEKGHGRNGDHIRDQPFQLSIVFSPQKNGHEITGQSRENPAHSEFSMR